MDWSKFRRKHPKLWYALAFLVLSAVACAISDRISGLIMDTILGFLWSLSSSAMWWMYEQRAWTYPVWTVVLAVIIVFSDDIKRWFSKNDEPDRDFKFESVIEYIRNRSIVGLGKEESEILLTLRQAARDGKVTVWARFGHKPKSSNSTDIYVVVDPEIFTENGFFRSIDWNTCVLATRHGFKMYDNGNMTYYDPMFSHEEIVMIFPRR